MSHFDVEISNRKVVDRLHILVLDKWDNFSEIPKQDTTVVKSTDNLFKILKWTDQKVEIKVHNYKCNAMVSIM